jgi:DNA-binding CsgD family transcriptional regulator
MSHCRTSFVRVCANRAELVGVDVVSLLSKHNLARARLDEVASKTPWPFFVELLAELERALGGARALEQLGAEISAAHPLFSLLARLHFSLEEVQYIAVDRLLPSLFSGVLLPLVRAQPDGAFRLTLSLNRELSPSYPFWTLLLGMWRPLPRLFQLADSLVEVEMADRFAEYLVILPQTTKPDKAYGREIRRSVREHLLKDLVVHEELFELPNPDLRSSILERRLEAAEGGKLLQKSDETEALKALKTDILTRLSVERLALYELTPSGNRRIAFVGQPLERARIRRTLWLDGNAVGAIEVPRPGEEGHARVASLLDEHIDSFALRFAQLGQGLLSGVKGRSFTQADSPIGDLSTGEPPPSSRGRLARAARDGRLRELAEQWQLTERQRAVLALLVEGLANKEIAARLACSVGTVENHVTRLLKSASVDGRAALTALFWRNPGR